MNLKTLAQKSVACVEQDIVQYALKIFPKLSLDLIEQNRNEIEYAMNSEKCCSICMGKGMCDELINTAGFIPILSLNSSGWMSITYRPCKFNGEAESLIRKRVAAVPFTKPKETIQQIDFGELGTEVILP